MPKRKKPERSAVLEQVLGPELWRRLTDLAGEENKAAHALVVEAVGELVERRSQPRAKAGSALPVIVKGKATP